MDKKTPSEEKAKKNREYALAYYYGNLERCRKEARERFYRKRDVMRTDGNARILNSDRVALYYANRILREIIISEDCDTERMMDILRKKSIEYMFDPQTMRRHVEIMQKRRHRVPPTDARKMATIIREAVKEYKMTRQYGKDCQEEERLADSAVETVVSGAIYGTHGGTVSEPR